MEALRELKHLLTIPFGPSPGNCDGCGLFLWSGRSLCRHCLRELDRVFSEALVFPHPLDPRTRCRSLWDWVPQESDALSSAILGLKGRGREKTWAELAQLFINQHAVEVFQKSEIRLFALPNSNPYRTHAADFAKGFAEILGVEGEELAQAATWGLPQKRKTRRQRLSDVRRVSMAPEARGGLRARGTPEDPARTVLWVLVDDIVTTGATSLMALRSLQEKSEGAGNSYEIWSLARRSRLAP